MFKIRLYWYPYLLFISTTICYSSLTSAQLLEEIVVTAQKREKSLQDTALSITAFSQLEMQRDGIEGLFDYGIRTPNLGLSNESDGRFTAGAPVIRGIAGGGFIGASGSGATGFYIDDIPVQDSLNPRVADLQRIEVLRGPQGTLYGARSMGGTVRLITRQADTEEFDANVHTKVSGVKEGDINWALDGSVNIPMIEGKLGMRAMAYYAADSGVFDRVHLLIPSDANATTPFPDQKNVDDDEYFGGQIALTWHATDNLTIKPRFMYQKTKSDNLPLADFNPDNFIASRQYNVTEPGEEEWWLASVTMDLDTGFGNIVSTTAVYDRDVQEFEDETGTIDSLFFAASGLPEPHIRSQIEQIERSEAVVHETRLITDYGDIFGDRIAMTLGVFYEKREGTLLYPTHFVNGLNETFTTSLNNAFGLGIPFPPGVFGSDLLSELLIESDSEEIALFGEVTFKVTDRIRLIGGLRWSDIETDVFSDNDGIFGVFSVSRSNQDSSVNPKVSIELDVNDDVMTYFSAAKGFRIGGNNENIPDFLCLGDLAAIGVNDFSDIEAFDSDTLWSYELGAKTSWFGDRLNLNMAAFYIDWSDIIQTRRLLCGFQFVTNAGHAENKGIEIEFDAALTDNWSMSMGLGLTEAKISNDGGPISGLSKGDRILQVPEVTFNAASEYTFPITGQWQGFIRGNISHYGDSLSANNSAIPRVRDSFTIMNLRLGASIDNKWDIGLFVDNVTNERANLSDNRSIAAEVPGRPRILTNRPRTIGLDVRRFF